MSSGAWIKGRDARLVVYEVTYGCPIHYGRVINNSQLFDKLELRLRGTVQPSDEVAALEQPNQYDLGLKIKLQYHGGVGILAS